MARTGRPTKLTRELGDEIVAAIREGNYLETAAALVGVNVSTVRHWLRRGRRQQGGLHADFSAAVRKAEGYAEQQSLDRIRQAAERGVWVADAWYLERKFPARWGRWDRVTHDVPSKANKAREAISRKEVRDLLDQAAEAMELASKSSGDRGPT